MSIADVSHRTRIPVRVIEALEKDDYGSFPSPTYAKSFLAQYAEFVGIDSSRWMDFFEPVAFTGPDDVLSIVDAPEANHHHTHHYHDVSVASPRHSRMPRGIGSTVMLVLVTGALAYALLKGWPVIEKKFSGIDITAKEPPPPPKFINENSPKQLPAEAPGSVPVNAPNAGPGATASQAPAVPANQPIPRAIIVD